MRIAIAAIFVAWAAVFALVVTEAHSPASPIGAPTVGNATPHEPWMVLERVPGGWRPVRGPFAGAEACLRISDALNNRNPGQVFDCDEVPNLGAARAAAYAHTSRSRTAG